MKRYLVFIAILLSFSTVSAERVYDMEWSYMTEGEVRNLCLMDNRIIFSSGAYKGFPNEYGKNVIHAFSLSGEKLWEEEFPDLIKTIQTKENIYFSSGRYFYCYSPSFSEQWHYSTNAEIRDFYVQDKKTFLFLEDDTITFLNENGRNIWERRIDSGVFLKFEYTGIYAGYYLQPYLYFLDTQGDITWKYKTAENVEYVHVEDLDEDGEPEILTSAYKYLTVTNKNGMEEWKFRADEYINDVYVSDNIYAVAGTTLYVLNRQGEIERKETGDDQIYLVKAEDIDGDGEKEVLLGCSQWSKEDQEWTEHYLSIGGKIVQKTNGRIRHVICVDTDGDGDKEIILGTNDLFFLKNNIVEIKEILQTEYEEAMVLYEKKDFEGAKNSFSDLKEQYTEYDLNTSEIEKMLQKIATYENGYKLYNAADAAFNKGAYESAKVNYQNARKYFEQVNDTAMLEEIEKKISLCEKEITMKTTTPPPEPAIMDYFRGMFLYLWIAVAGVLIVLILILIRRRR